VTNLKTSSTGPVRIERLDGGELWRVFLARPKGNVLDEEMIDALSAVFDEAQGATDLKAICLSADGPHFSFGASVQEHLPGRVSGMLRTFHQLIVSMADAAVTTLAAVRGRCLGGGLELAASCHRVFAAPAASLGQPEIKLGVFAPLGSLILPERIGMGAAADLCLTGRSLGGEEARRVGLVDELAEDPDQAAVDYARQHLLPHSAASLRHAVRAVRHAFDARLFGRLEDVERLYLGELMKTADAVEGLNAFLEKRPPRWRNA
jgi:cyclohexa-1,5-dienecarbonyl-CoA hydratase